MRVLNIQSHRLSTLWQISRADRLHHLRALKHVVAFLPMRSSGHNAHVATSLSVSVYGYKLHTSCARACYQLFVVRPGDEFEPSPR